MQQVDYIKLQDYFPHVHDKYLITSKFPHDGIVYVRNSNGIIEPVHKPTTSHSQGWIYLLDYKDSTSYDKDDKVILYSSSISRIFDMTLEKSSDKNVESNQLTAPKKSLQLNTLYPEVKPYYFVDTETRRPYSTFGKDLKWLKQNGSKCYGFTTLNGPQKWISAEELNYCNLKKAFIDHKKMVVPPKVTYKYGALVAYVDSDCNLKFMEPQLLYWDSESITKAINDFSNDPKTFQKTFKSVVIDMHCDNTITQTWSK